MPINVTDKRLLETQTETHERTTAVPLDDPRAQTFMSHATDELTESIDLFGAAIESEDVEEFEAIAARNGLNEAIERLDLGFGKMRTGIDITLSHLELAGEPPVRADEIKGYIEDHTTSSFSRANVKLVRSVVDRGLRYANTLLPDNLRDDIVQEVDQSLDGFLTARETFAKENAEHMAAFEKLEDARSHARRAHLVARDLISAALRREGIHNRLNALIPPLRKAMYGRSNSPSPADDADAPSPTPQPTPEPIEE